MEQLDKLVLSNTSWDQLPAAVKQALGNSRSEYGKAVLDRCYRYQVRWAGCIAQEIIKDEKMYYSDMLAFLRKHLLVRSAFGII